MSASRRKKENIFYSMAAYAGTAMRERAVASPFLIKVKPYPGELFSSYMVRMSIRHLMDPVTFTNFHFPEEMNDFFSRDKDVSVSNEIIKKTASKALVDKSVIFDTTLKSYEGVLWEKIHPFTRNQFILNPMIRGRAARKNGLRFCPECLKEKEYFRKEWRLSFSTVCPKHRCYLYEKCSKCRLPLTISKRKHDIQEFNCYRCGYQFKRAGFRPVAEGSLASQNLAYLYDVMREGWVKIGGEYIYAVAYFMVLNQISKLIYNFGYQNHPLFQKEMELLGLDEVVPKKRGMPVQEAGVKEHIVIYTTAVEILKSERNLKSFIEMNKIRYTELMKDMRYVPFWYHTIIESYLGVYPAPCDAEVESAIKYMKKYRMPLTIKTLSQVMGTRIDKRRRGDIFGDFLNSRELAKNNFGKYYKEVS